MNQPPFSPASAQSARQRLGLSPQQVSEQMSVLWTPVDPEVVVAWESDAYRPTEQQLFAMANVLWCSTSELMGIEKPCTLRQLRLARQLSAVRLAQRIDMDVFVYTWAEEENRWAGDLHQTLALLSALNISLRQLADATGRSAALAAESSVTPRKRRRSHLWPWKPAAPAAGAHEPVTASAEAWDLVVSSDTGQSRIF
ncbi:XRE family transcriptional regulator [Streptomyces sp. NPDC001373]|uniref:XRE family transcriptional regulator n=1 Tax=Streptomyces sp. NPDC001373 TaxID=3364565 RepID=UPI0036AAC4D1